MMRAYDEACLERARDVLGSMLDFAVHSLHIDAVVMLRLFASSESAFLFERGDIRTLYGLSGAELAFRVLDSSRHPFERVSAGRAGSLSAEYWCGSCLAYIQFFTCRSFAEILKDFSVADLASDYSERKSAVLEGLPLTIDQAGREEALLEFGASYANDAARRHIEKDHAEGPSSGSRLKEERLRNGLSQSMLSRASGVPLRTLQQYEQGQKDIKKARAVYVLSLARVLHCDPSSLLD